MAAETPDQPPASTPSPEGGAGGGGESAAPAPAKGGLSAYLPLIIAVVVMPVAAFFTLELKSSKAKKAETAEKPAEEGDDSKSGAQAPEESASGGGETDKTKPRKVKRNAKIPVPLTRDLVSYRAADAAKEGDFDKIVTLDIKGETRDLAQADKIVVNIANERGTRFAVARFSLLGDHPDLLEKVNQSRERLIDIASGTLSTKTLDDISRSGFRNILRGELIALFNHALGGTYVQDVVITDFVIQ